MGALVRLNGTFNRAIQDKTLAIVGALSRRSTSLAYPAGQSFLP